MSRVSGFRVYCKLVGKSGACRLSLNSAGGKQRPNELMFYSPRDREPGNQDSGLLSTVHLVGNLASLTSMALSTPSKSYFHVPAMGIQGNPQKLRI